jgi:REP element-mobilizing transposase RayT
VTRGNNRRPIFGDDRDRTLFCLTVTRVVRRHGWSVLAYVLMRNHYHLLVSTSDDSLAVGMHNVNHSYAVTFNARHGRINHLFGKRYWSRRVDTDASLMAAARYIVQNPRRAGNPVPLEEHTWSSYAATIGVEHARIPLARDELLPYFGRTPAIAVAGFREFCEHEPLRTELDEPRPVPGTVQ